MIALDDQQVQAQSIFQRIPIQRLGSNSDLSIMALDPCVWWSFSSSSCPSCFCFSPYAYARPLWRCHTDLWHLFFHFGVPNGHEETRKLKELVRAYETLSIDTKRTMTRIKAIFRGHGIRTPGSGVYQLKQREQWLKML